MDIKERYSVARDKYFTMNPQAAHEINSVSKAVIEAAGMGVDEYREQARAAAFVKAAEARDIEVDEFVIQLVADSPEQAQTWRMDRHRKIARTLGIEWDDYKQLNRIAE